MQQISDHLDRLLDPHPVRGKVVRGLRRRGWYLAYVVVALLVFGWIVENEDWAWNGNMQLGAFSSALFWPLYIGGKLSIAFWRLF